MAYHHLALSHTPRNGRWKASLREALNWVMVLIVLLAASAGFTLDHLLPIFP